MYDKAVPLFNRPERVLLDAVSRLAFANPFLPELAENEKAALGDEYQPEPPFWSLEVSDPGKRRPNAWRVVARVDALARDLPRRLRRGLTPNDAELSAYEAASLYSLYHEFYDRIGAALASAAPGSTLRVRLWPEFVAAWQRRLTIAGFEIQPGFAPAHALACFFQFARAFQQIFDSIIGASGPAGRLRAAVWQSIFTHDLKRYWRTYYARMGEFVTLVTGPSGSGKELVARAIARSRYLPFDERAQAFPEDGTGLFHPVHIGALPSTLIESELFGHRKGAYTGAIQDRRGWLDVCPPHGAVFLDEIGELAPDIQVKLLRVIETREFTAVGDTSPKRFHGKLIAATNRDLPAMIGRSDFREDLYYRLCSDLITTPSLEEQVRDSPDLLRELVRFMARKHAGPEEAAFAEEAYEWIEQNLGLDYPWPGNYRELEQCVRNLIVRSEYRPARSQRPEPEDIFAAAREGRLTANELVQRYCTLVYAATRSYQETARRLGLDRRTVKSRIDQLLFQRLISGGSSARGAVQREA